MITYIDFISSRSRAAHSDDDDAEHEEGVLNVEGSTSYGGGGDSLDYLPSGHDVLALARVTVLVVDAP